MKTKQNIILLLLMLLSAISYSQDKIQLKAGAIIKGKLTPQNQDYSSLEKITMESTSGKIKKIPLKAISKITLANGKQVFPVIKENIVKELISTSQYDSIFLKTGKAILGNLNLNGQKASSLDRIPFTNTKGVQKSIPIIAISKIINKQGKIIYPPQNNSVQNTVENCKQKTKKLKQEISETALNRYIEIQEEIKNKTSKASPASYTMEEKVKEQVYNALKYKITELKEFSTSIDAIIFVEVDKEGKLINHADTIFKYNQLRNYTKLRDTEIYPFLENKIFPTSELKIDYSGEYEKLYEQFKKRIKETNCENEFEDVLSLAKNKFNSLEKKFIKTNTIYKIPIKYNFTKRDQKWTYFNGTLRIKKSGNKYISISNSKTKKDFLANVKYKQKNAIYKVNATYYSLLGDSSTIAINTVKRKYKYLTHFGVSLFGHMAIPSTRGNFNVLRPLLTYNVKLILHRIGFFAGGMYNPFPVQNQIPNSLDGRFVQKTSPLYIEAGIYVGVFQYFFLKAGFNYFNDTIITYSNSVQISSLQEKKHGFTTGIALIFPVIHLEWGYNFMFNSAYVGLGLHVTLNK